MSCLGNLGSASLVDFLPVLASPCLAVGVLLCVDKLWNTLRIRVLNLLPDDRLVDVRTA